MTQLDVSLLDFVGERVSVYFQKWAKDARGTHIGVRLALYR